MTSYAIERISLKDDNYILIRYDEWPLNPRKEYEPLGHMICWHKNYKLGDEHSYHDPTQFVIELYNELMRNEYATNLLYRNVGENYQDIYDLGYDWLVERIQKNPDIIWRRLDKLAVILPLYLYDHSGITMNTTGFRCPWDSGQVGYIYLSNKEIKKEYSWKRLTEYRKQAIKKYLKESVNEYDCYLTGEVYSYEVYDSNDNIIDGCSGFYGRDAVNEAITEYIKFLQSPKSIDSHHPTDNAKQSLSVS